MTVFQEIRDHQINSCIKAMPCFLSENARGLTRFFESKRRQFTICIKRFALAILYNNTKAFAFGSQWFIDSLFTDCDSAT